MALAKLDFFSESLGMCSSIYVVIPQKSVNGQIGIGQKSGEDKYKSLLLLHGLSDDESIWLRRTSIERYATEAGIALILPCGARSFYCDMKYGGKFYTYIAKEVPKIAREFFPISDKREDSFVAGLSMGGYGALKIGLRENESFCAAAGLSSVTDIQSRLEDKGDQYVNFIESFRPIYGEDLKMPLEDDLFYLSKSKSEEALRPRIYMAVGKDDFLYEDNIKLKNHFETLPYDFTYVEDEGAHSWAFWDKHIQGVLNWMLK